MTVPEVAPGASRIDGGETVDALEREYAATGAEIAAVLAQLAAHRGDPAWAVWCTRALGALKHLQRRRAALKVRVKAARIAAHAGARPAAGPGSKAFGQQLAAERLALVRQITATTPDADRLLGLAHDLLRRVLTDLAPDDVDEEEWAVFNVIGDYVRQRQPYPYPYPTGTFDGDSR